MIDRHADTWQVDYLARLAAECNLQIPVLHSPFLFNIPYWPAHQGECIERTVKKAEELGAETVVVHLRHRWPFSVLSSNRKLFPLPHFWHKNTQGRDWFEPKLPQLQAQSSVAIAVEIMPIRRLFGLWAVNGH